MNRLPRPKGSGVITRRMWFGIAFVGLIMAAGTLLVLDFGQPGGLVRGSGDLSYARTMAFTTLVLFQLFNDPNARSDERTAFHRLFRNQWLRRARAVACAADPGRLRTVLATCVRYRGHRIRRMARVRRGRQLGPVVARVEHVGSLREIRDRAFGGRK
jgi:Cation transporting ATPase, C-terminus